MTTTTEAEKAGYHHGNLLETLLEAAVSLIAEQGVEALSVRQLAKRAGVSPGAPFRHFDSKKALLTAVAEQAMRRLTAAVGAALAELGEDDPVAALRAMGRAYLDWAVANPTHFQVISSRSAIDFHGSTALVEANEALRLTVVRLVQAAHRQGRLRPGVQAEDLVFAARALVYGMARMWVDQHFPEWKVDRPVAEATHRALDLFIDSALRA